MAFTDAKQAAREELPAGVLSREHLARKQLVQLFPGVSTRIITSVFSAYRRVTPTVAAALRAARGRIDDAREVVMSSSIGSYVDEDRTAVAVYLTQHDVDQIQLGLPVDLEAVDDRGKMLSVHVRRERRRQPRPPGTSTDPAARATAAPHLGLSPVFHG